MGLVLQLFAEDAHDLLASMVLFFCPRLDRETPLAWPYLKTAGPSTRVVMTTEWVLWHPTLRFAQDGALDSVAPLDNPDSRVFGRDDDALEWWYPTLPLRVAQGSG
jgi:hypothetical protein